MIIGATGSGKSVLLGLMVAAATGLPRVSLHWLDIDYSSFVLAHALDADYRELASGGAAPLTPFQHLDEPGGAESLLGWLIPLFLRLRIHPNTAHVIAFELALQL